MENVNLFTTWQSVQLQDGKCTLCDKGQFGKAGSSVCEPCAACTYQSKRCEQLILLDKMFCPVLLKLIPLTPLSSCHMNNTVRFLLLAYTKRTALHLHFRPNTVR